MTTNKFFVSSYVIKNGKTLDECRLVEVNKRTRELMTLLSLVATIFYKILRVEFIRLISQKS